jgi:polyketide synthase 12/myxalamid-type polyketide synthase MxaB
MAARLKDTEGRRWSAAGVGWIEPDRGFETLARLIDEQQVQAAVLPINWTKFFAKIPRGAEPPWLSEMAREGRAGGQQVEAGPPVLLEKLKEVTPGERLETTVMHMRRLSARVLALDESELPDPRRPLNELGFDSLTAVEFCNALGHAIANHINPTILFEYPTLERLAVHVLRDVVQLEFEGAPEEEVDESPVPQDDSIRAQALEDVEGLSEDEMNALVAEQLEKLNQ